MSTSAVFNALMLVGPALSFPGNIRSQHSGKCWDLPGQDFSNGNKIWQWTCANFDNQRWTLHEDFTLRPTTNPEKCIDVNGGDYVGTPQYTPQPQIWDCVGTPQQMVGYDDAFGTIYFAATEDAAYCVDLAGGGMDNGHPLIVWNCNGETNQQWKYTPDSGPAPPPPPFSSSSSYIKSKETNKCLDVPGGNMANGQELWIWECEESSRQQWVFRDGTISSVADSSKCVGLKDSDTANGNHIQIWDCGGTPQQMWGYDEDRHSIYMSSSSSDASKCFQMSDGSSIDGTILEVWDCLPYGNQQWYVEAAASTLVVM